MLLMFCLNVDLKSNRRMMFILRFLAHTDETIF